MSAKFAYFIKIFILVQLTGFYTQPLQAFGEESGKVISCVRSQSKTSQVCILQSTKLQLGAKVVIYTPKRYWVAAGKVIKIKGPFGIAVFDERNSIVRDGYSVAISSPTRQESEWSYAFSKE